MALRDETASDQFNLITKHTFNSEEPLMVVKPANSIPSFLKLDWRIWISTEKIWWRRDLKGCYLRYSTIALIFKAALKLRRVQLKHARGKFVHDHTVVTSNGACFSPYKIYFAISQRVSEINRSLEASSEQLCRGHLLTMRRTISANVSMSLQPNRSAI